MEYKYFNDTDDDLDECITQNFNDSLNSIIKDSFK